MWFQKLLIIYLLTLFNSLDGYYLDKSPEKGEQRQQRTKGIIKSN